MHVIKVDTWSKLPHLTLSRNERHKLRSKHFRMNRISVFVVVIGVYVCELEFNCDTELVVKSHKSSLKFRCARWPRQHLLDDLFGVGEL